MNWAVFLDRDGVINEEVNYLSQPEQIRLISGTSQAIQKLNHQSIPAIVVTNQAGIARGYFSEMQLAKIHQTLAIMLSEDNAYLDRLYYCPHHPTAGISSYRQACTCRKPQPGMFLQAADDFDLDLSACYLIGDKATDLLAAHTVGCYTILVQTGYGKEEWEHWQEKFQPNYVALDLLHAVQWILIHKKMNLEEPAVGESRVKRPVSEETVLN